MNDSYTVLWNQDRVRIARQGGLLGKPLDRLFGGPHLSQPSFSRAGVRPGDFIYPIRVADCALHVMGRVTVREIVSLESYFHSHPDLFPPSKIGAWPMQTLENYLRDHPEMKALAWSCTDEVVIGRDGTPLALRRPLPREMLERLHYRSLRAERPVKGVRDGRLTSVISIQGIYRLTIPSAEDFASLVDSLNPPEIEFVLA